MGKYKPEIKSENDHLEEDFDNLSLGEDEEPKIRPDFDFSTIPWNEIVLFVGGKFEKVKSGGDFDANYVNPKVMKGKDALYFKHLGWIIQNGFNHFNSRFN